MEQSQTKESSKICDILKRQLPKDFSISFNTKFEIAEYGDVHVTAIRRGKWDIASLQYIDDKEPSPEETFSTTIKDMLYLQYAVHHGFYPVFFVIAYKEKLYIWRNYTIIKPKQAKKRPYIFDIWPEQSDFFQNVVENARIVSIVELVDIFCEYNPSTYCKLSQGGVENFFLSTCPQKLHDTIRQFVDALIKEGIEKCTNGGTSYFWLMKEVEDIFFRFLLEPGYNHSCYRYVNTGALQKMMDNGTIAMSSIISMNDSSEADYASCYLNEKIGSKLNRHQIGLNTLPEDIVNTFICSMSEEDDNLAMWYMYGEQCKGAELVFDINNTDDDSFCLARVSYSDKDGHNEILDYIASLLNSDIKERRFCLQRWDIWQHFFKPYYYQQEKEIRLLFQHDWLIGKNMPKCEWIVSANGIHFPVAVFTLKKDNASNDTPLFPLRLKEVKLGPLYPEARANAMSLETDMEERLGLSLKFSESSIKWYRG